MIDTSFRKNWSGLICIVLAIDYTWAINGYSYEMIVKTSASIDTKQAWYDKTSFNQVVGEFAKSISRFYFIWSPLLGKFVDSFGDRPTFFSTHFAFWYHECNLVYLQLKSSFHVVPIFLCQIHGQFPLHACKWNIPSSVLHGSSVVSFHFSLWCFLQASVILVKIDVLFLKIWISFATTVWGCFRLSLSSKYLTWNG